MTSVARIAAPAQARHFATTAILALGIVIVLSPYAWLEEWRLVGFSGAYLPYHLWGLSPFALLAALIGRSYGISWLAAWVLVVPVVLGTVISLALTQSTGTGRTVSVGMPAVLLLTLIAAWQLQAH